MELHRTAYPLLMAGPGVSPCKACDRVDRRGKRDHVAVLGIDVEEIGLVRQASAIADGFLGHDFRQLARPFVIETA